MNIGVDEYLQAKTYANIGLKLMAKDAVTPKPQTSETRIGRRHPCRYCLEDETCARRWRSCCAKHERGYPRPQKRRLHVMQQFVDARLFCGAFDRHHHSHVGGSTHAPSVNPAAGTNRAPQRRGGRKTAVSLDVESWALHFECSALASNGPTQLLPPFPTKAVDGRPQPQNRSTAADQQSQREQQGRERFVNQIEVDTFR